MYACEWLTFELPLGNGTIIPLWDNVAMRPQNGRDASTRGWQPDLPAVSAVAELATGEAHHWWLP